jgi:hypothetical protein
MWVRLASKSLKGDRRRWVLQQCTEISGLQRKDQILAQSMNFAGAEHGGDERSEHCAATFWQKEATWGEPILSACCERPLSLSYLVPLFSLAHLPRQ